MKVTIYTFGCKQNYAESSALARQFEQLGCSVVTAGEESDIVIINTCSVTETADRECRRIVRSIHSRFPKAKIIVTGCYAQLKPVEVSAIDGVTLVVGNPQKHALLNLLKEQSTEATNVIVTDDLRTADLEFVPAVFSEHDTHTRAFLKLQDGCDYSCSFCTIPHARGRSRSMAFEEVHAHVRHLVESGYREIVLTGINLGEYRAQTGERLIDVLRLLVSLRLQCRYRLSSIEPNRLHPEIIEFIAAHSELCPHFHIPLQSGSPEILRAMRRRYNRELYAERVLLIKSLMPHACIGVDVMTGFPGESQRHFEETYQFIESLPVSYLHVFTYSERSRTDAAHRHDQVPYRIRKERTAILRQLGQQKKQQFYAENIGYTRKVLIETFDEGIGGFVGYTENYIRVAVPQATPGTIVTASIARCDANLAWADVLDGCQILPKYVGLSIV